MLKIQRSWALNTIIFPGPACPQEHKAISDSSQKLSQL